jgi:hypothetical protein
LADAQIETQITKAFDVESFIFETPLYESTEVDKEDQLDKLYAQTNARFNGHCVGCQSNSVFAVNTNYAELGTFVRGEQRIIGRTYYGINLVELSCARNEHHKLTIFVQLNHKISTDNVKLVSFVIKKIGQAPSHADISNARIKDYSAVLNKIDRAEIGRANGIAAHGVNIGAFVYLRRVIERLVDRHYMSSGIELPNDDFMKLRMPEKISELKDHLPPFMLENRMIYSILSKGIHELTEDECGNYYEVMLESILLILDQDKQKLEADKKKESIKKALGKIASTIGSTNKTEQ